MSTSKSVPPEPWHALEEATRWFNQWHVYRSIVDASAAALAPDALASTTEHVVQRDFPETAAVIGSMARDAGFGAEPRELARDATGFHRLLAFTTGSAP